MAKIPEWKKYQNNVSELLSSLGFETDTDQTIDGARGRHGVDVTARMTIAGIPQLWVVECKLWKRPVPKERALTFLAIVQDVGADRGLLFSESGFQAGAVRAVANTNISLTSIPDFKANVSEELAEIRITTLDRRGGNPESENPCGLARRRARTVKGAWQIYRSARHAWTP